MSIIVQCDCGKKYKVGDDKAGKKMRCKACNGVMSIPEPADESDDFGDGGDDFGDDGFHDFSGDDWGDEDSGEAEAAPRPKSKSGAGSKGKGGGKSKGKGKKSAKSDGMAPALKYSLAGGIVVVTAGIVLGILYSRGVIGGGGKKDGGDKVAKNDGDTPPGGANPGGGNPAGQNPRGPNPGGGNPNGLPPSGNPGWRKYVAKDRRFETEFPSRVIERTINTLFITYNHVTGGTRNRAYAIRFTTILIKRNVSDAQRMKRLELWGAALKYKSKKRITILGKPGLETVRDGPSGTQIVHRLCIVGDRLYELTVSGPEQNWDEESANRFFNSFRAPAGAGGGTKTPPDGKPGTPFGRWGSNALLLRNKPGDRSWLKRRILVFGKVAKPLSRDGWITFEGDGTRSVACHFATPPTSPPGVGQIVTIEGEFTRNNQQFITLIKCRIVPGGGKPLGNGGKTPPGTGKPPRGGTVRQLRSWKHNTGDEEKNSIASMAFSPDGKSLAAVGRDGIVRLWDPHTGRNIATWKGHTGYLHAVAFHAKGRLVASGGDDKLVKLWDVKTGRNTFTLKGHEEGVKSLAFSPDGNTLASSGDVVLLWNVNTGAKIGQLRGNAPTAVDFSADGKLLATGSYEGRVTLWNVATRKPVGTLRPASASQGPPNPIEHLAFSPDGKTLATGGDRDTITLWDVKTRKRPMKLKGGRDSSIFGLAFSPNGRIVAGMCVHPEIKVWDTRTGRRLATLKGHRSTLHSIAFSPDGKLLATGDTDNFIKIWDVSSLAGGKTATSGPGIGDRIPPDKRESDR